MPREALAKISKPKRMQPLALNLNALAHAMLGIRISEPTKLDKQVCREPCLLKFQSRARYDARFKILKLRRITAVFALNLKPIGDRAEF